MSPFFQSLEPRELFAAALPGQIEFEDFIAGAEGSAYHDTESANFG